MTSLTIVDPSGDTVTHERDRSAKGRLQLWCRIDGQRWPCSPVTAVQQTETARQDRFGGAA